MATEKRLKDVCLFEKALEKHRGLVMHNEDILAALANCPTVDAVEVVHGRWVMRGGRRYCSACQQRACVTRDSDDFWYTVGTDYCPNCGAKMDGDGNG